MPGHLPRHNLSIRQTADGAATLYSPTYGQTYHSEHGAVIEARHVFIRGTEYRAPARVLEVGFGAGLNFLVTASERQEHILRYTALERFLPPSDLLQALDYGAAVGRPRLWAALVEWRRGLPFDVPVGTHRFSCMGCELDLLMGEATEAKLPARAFEAVYLDPFSPRANPELWTPGFLALLYRATAPGGRIATYSAAGTVRRSLAAAGYEVRREAGPPGKREFLSGLRKESRP